MSLQYHYGNYGKLFQTYSVASSHPPCQAAGGVAVVVIWGFPVLTCKLLPWYCQVRLLAEWWWFGVSPFSHVRLKQNKRGVSLVYCRSGRTC